MRYILSIITVSSLIIGQTTTKIGNYYYNSDGTVITKVGNSYYNSNGNTTTKVGNSFYNSGYEPNLVPIIDNERNKSSDDLFDTDIWGNKKKKCC